MIHVFEIRLERLIWLSQEKRTLNIYSSSLKAKISPRSESNKNGDNNDNNNNTTNNNNKNFNDKNDKTIIIIIMRTSHDSQQNFTLVILVILVTKKNQSIPSQMIGRDSTASIFP